MKKERVDVLAVQQGLLKPENKRSAVSWLD